MHDEYCENIIPSPLCLFTPYRESYAVHNDDKQCPAAGELMDNIGGHVNPLHLVRQLPAGMEIPGLRDRLVRSDQRICIFGALQIPCTRWRACA